MTDELYINGTRADMKADSGVYLDYNSGILSDLDNIDSNYSYTIKLPKTARNLMILGGLILPSSNGDFPSKNNVATLLRDGVALVENATLNLLEVNADEIDVSISWGVGALLDNIKDMSIAETSWAQNTVLEWVEDNFPYALYGEQRTKGKHTQPAVLASEIMEAINAECGNVISYDDTQAAQHWVPILKRTAVSKTSNAAVTITAMVFDYTEAASFNYAIFFTGNVNTDYSNYLGWVSSGYSKEIDGFDTALYVALNVLIQTDYKIVFSAKTYTTRTPYPILIRAGYSGSRLLQIEALETEEENVWLYYGEYTFNEADKVEQISFYSQQVMGDYATELYDVNVTVSINKDDDDATPATGSTITNNNRLRLSENLADIECTDFIKGICGLFGKFPCEVGGKVQLCPYDDLCDIERAVDWSDYLLSTDEYPTEMDISADGLARENRFTFGNDDDCPDSAGTLKVDNTALDKTTDFMQVEFQACEDSGSIANIPIDTIDTEETEEDTNGNTVTHTVYKFDDSDDCYLLYKEANTQFSNGALYFQDFKYYLRLYYSKFAELIKNRVITETFKLDVVTLKNMDMTRAVYLSKYGRYFAIIEVKTKENDIAEVKLLTL